ncbi:MAG TPA: histidine phosphatase family protein [Myxococcota bacterium]|nr:histidine phosphatase family protein [Myxococcota bacterium]
MPSWDPVTLEELPCRRLVELHLFRHGQAETGGLRRAYGHTDYALSTQGRVQSDALASLARRLERPMGVISSDLSRCSELGERLAAEHDLPLSTSPALREQFMGDWEGRPWAELNSEDPVGTHAYWMDYLHARPPGGETWGEMAGRVLGWFEEADLADGSWLVVTHIGVIRALLCHHLGLPMDEALRWAPAPGSHSHLLLAEAGAVLSSLGAVPGEAGRPRLQRPPRVAMSGSAGIGKTTLGRRIAEHLGVPFIEEGMRRRLERGLQLHRTTRQERMELIRALWREQVAAEDRAMAAGGGFVADRSSIDFAAFWLHYRFTEPDDGATAFLAEAFAHATRYDHIVLPPFGTLPLVPDGIRATNPHLQRLFHGLVHGLLVEEASDRLVELPRICDLEARLSWLLQELNLPED